MSQQFHTFCAVLVVLVVLALESSQSPFTGLFFMYGVKSNNSLTDVGPGDKLMAVYHDIRAQRVRFDTTDTLGEFISTSVDFPSEKWYMNMVTHKVCVFEHVNMKPGEAGPRLLPNEDWVKLLKPVGLKTINGILCNHYVIPKGYLASSLAFFFINFFDHSFVELHYYENQKTLMPVRFSVEQNDPSVLPDTHFDVFRYENVNQSFPAITFTQNIMDTCH